MGRRGGAFSFPIGRAVHALGLAYFAVFAARPDLFGAETIWDAPMAASGFALMLVLVPLLALVQGAIRREIEDLLLSGAIVYAEATPNAILRQMRQVEWRWRAIQWLIVSAILVVSIVLGDGTRAEKASLVAGAIIVAWLAAERFAAGMALAHGPVAQAGPVRYHLTPGHPDGGAGFGRLGRLYFEQALLLLLPALYLGFWWLGSVQAMEAMAGDMARPFGLGPATFERYIACPGGVRPPCEGAVYRWADLHAALIAMNLVLFLAASLVPAFVVHRHMTRAFRADIAPRLPGLRAELHALRAARDAGAQPRLLQAAERYDALRLCPVWPLSVVTLSLTLVANVSSVLGVVAVLL